MRKKSNRMIIRTNACRHRCNMWWQKRRMAVCVCVRARAWCFIYRAQFAPNLFETSFFCFRSSCSLWQNNSKEFIVASRNVIMCIENSMFVVKWKRAIERKSGRTRLRQIHSTFSHSLFTMLMCQFYCVQTFASCPWSSFTAIPIERIPKVKWKNQWETETETESVAYVIE